MNKKFYQQTWFIIASLLIFFPAGLYLMWKYADWKKNIKLIITGILVLCMVFGQFVPTKNDSSPAAEKTPISDTNATKEESTTKATKKKSAETKTKKLKKEIKNLKGQNVAKVEDTLSDIKYHATYTFDTTDMDYTDSIASMDRATRKHFIVTEVNDIDMSNKTVDLTITSKEVQNQENTEKKLRNKLSEGSSCVAISHYGKAEYPYGFKFSALTATFSLYDDNTWSVHGNCKITNEFGAEAKMECVARVTGSTDNPEVVYFEVR